jgi:membrane-bound metal-dependent hydrolase YbcI (DUF457 family)
MPSPIGHLLAGAAAAWSVDLLPGRRVLSPPTSESSLSSKLGGPLTVYCAILGASPDLDLLIGGHRTYSHSLTAVAVVAALTAFIAMRSGLPALRMAAVCGAAYGSHLLLDLIAVDVALPKGIQLLWPFDDRWFITRWMVFRPTERHAPLSAFAMERNTLAALQELAIMLPIIAGLWWARLRAIAHGSRTTKTRSREEELEAS